MNITYHHASITALRDSLSKLSHAFWRIYPTYLNGLYDGECVRVDISALEVWHQAVKKATLLLADDCITDICSPRICSARLIALISYHKEELKLAVDDIVKTLDTNGDLEKEGVLQSTWANKATKSIIAGLRCHYLGTL